MKFKEWLNKNKRGLSVASSFLVVAMLISCVVPMGKNGSMSAYYIEGSYAWAEIYSLTCKDSDGDTLAIWGQSEMDTGMIKEIPGSLIIDSIVFVVYVTSAELLYPTAPENCVDILCNVLEDGNTIDSGDRDDGLTVFHSTNQGDQAILHCTWDTNIKVKSGSNYTISGWLMVQV